MGEAQHPATAGTQQQQRCPTSSACDQQTGLNSHCSTTRQNPTVWKQPVQPPPPPSAQLLLHCIEWSDEGQHGANRRLQSIGIVSPSFAFALHPSKPMLQDQKLHLQVYPHLSSPPPPPPHRMNTGSEVSTMPTASCRPSWKWGPSR
jgi:hypothetical protein